MTQKLLSPLFAPVAASALLFTTSAFAQAPAAADDIATLRAELDKLRAEVAELKKKQTEASTAAVPSWKGAPQLEDKAKGWSFKPRGRIQYDAGVVGEPGAIQNRNLGFNSRVRRLRLGAEGSMPGGFGYKVDVDFVNSTVGFGDAFLTYTSKDKTFGVKIGNQESLNGLDQMTSSNVVTFTERAQMNDAFANTRRLGVSAGYYNGDELRLEAGLFAGHSIDASVDNDGWIAAARAVYAPEIAGGRLHIGANFQHRDFQSNNNGVTSTSVGAPSTNQLARYRARPFSQLTDVRFVDTGSFAAKGDDIFGLELGGIFKSIYFASEAQWTKTRAYDAGSIQTGLDSFAGGNIATVATGNPGFFSGYGEVGVFLTGETRGYKEGAWGRTKVLKPFDKGGWGAVQLAARFDHLDLDSDKLKAGQSNNFTTGIATPSVNLARGGKQTGYLLGLNWYPIDYIRFMVNYSRVQVEGGPLAAAAKPLSTLPIDERKYGLDVFAVRAQVEF
jgi:phosphate-selective porin OprO and OprP